MTEILKDRALMFSADDGFWTAVNDEGTGPYLTDGLFSLTEGEVYTIIINGTTYTGEAVTATVTGIGDVVGIGNADALTGGEGNGEPYAAGFTQASETGSAFIFMWFDTATAAEGYTISLYEGVEEEEPEEPTEPEVFAPEQVNVVLYDRNGEPVNHSGIKTVTCDTDVEGTTATFTLGTAPDETTVALDLAEGDQVVQNTETGLLKKVVIEKPDTLLPENIAKDVEIAGVVGTMTAGVEPVSPSDITFYDYDGTIVAAWTLEELEAATELPANPKHDGLVAQGWNWTLADLKAANCIADVGQIYVTDDGKTRLYISFARDGTFTVPVYFSQTMANGVTIDWGDGSATETVAGTGSVTVSHTYSNVSECVISLDPANGCTLSLGSGSSNICVLGATANASRIIVNTLKKVEIGEGVTGIEDYAFSYCGLHSITIPNGLTSIGNYAFSYCGLHSITIPNGLTSIGNYAFRYSCLQHVTLSNGLTSIGDYAFISSKIERIVPQVGLSSFGTNVHQENIYLREVVIPSSVTKIGNYAFMNCYSVFAYYVKPTTPPTIGGSTFPSVNNFPTDCIIYVPKGCLSAYKAATYWKNYASQMQEEP